MARARSSPQHKALGAFLARKRQDAGMRQVDLAKKLKRRQDYVSDIERGQKLVNVVELLEWSAAIGFDPHEAVRALEKQ
jgi:ribosome-binding protein aMBF1 (putative translation factor)